jgi:hypothetical protein
LPLWAWVSACNADAATDLRYRRVRASRDSSETHLRLSTEILTASVNCKSYLVSPLKRPVLVKDRNRRRGRRNVMPMWSGPRVAPVPGPGSALSPGQDRPASLGLADDGRDVPPTGACHKAKRAGRPPISPAARGGSAARVTPGSGDPRLQRAGCGAGRVFMPEAPPGVGWSCTFAGPSCRMCGEGSVSSGSRRRIWGFRRCLALAARPAAA